MFLISGVNMRNLIQYPITEEEVLATLEYALERQNCSGEIGGNDGFILDKIQTMLKNEPHIMSKLIDYLKI